MMTPLDPSNPPAAAQASEWNHSLTGDYLWSNVNFGEAVTAVMTPLTWSVIRFTLDDWIFLPGFPTVGVIGGRPYLNISIFATLFEGLGRSRQDLLRYMESTLYLPLPAEMPIPTIPVSRLDLLRGLLYSLRIRTQQRWFVHKAPAYLATNKGWFEHIRNAIQSQSTAAGLARLWWADMRPHLKHGVWCVLGSVTHSADYTLQLRRRLEPILGPQDANILIANLSDEDAPLESLGPVIGLDRLVRGQISTPDYLENYGHRGPHEFELSVPRPAEDPAWLEQELERMRRSPVDVSALLADQRRAFDLAWARLQAHSPRSAGRIARMLAESARRARLRELARSAYVRDRWAVRLFALRAAQLTALGDQIFFLTLDELLALLSGDRSATQAIPSRQIAYAKYKDLPAYPSVICGPFDPFAWAAGPNRPSDIFDAHTAPAARTASGLVLGSPASAGVVEGLVRLVEKPEDSDTLQPGEILLAVQTDIAWTLLFPRAAAVITDIGAPLSHAAIVARELGIPAVVGCGDATARLKTGDRVRLDGARGTVEILATQPPLQL